MVEENGVKKSLSQNRQQLLVLLILQAITELTFQKAAEPVFWPFQLFTQERMGALGNATLQCKLWCCLAPFKTDATTTLC